MAQDASKQGQKGTDQEEKRAADALAAAQLQRKEAEQALEDANEKLRLATEAPVAARQKVSEAEQKKATADAQLAQASQDKTQAEQKVKDAQRDLENKEKQIQQATDALKGAEQQAQQAQTEEETQKAAEAKTTADAQLAQASQDKTQAEQKVKDARQDLENKEKQVQQATAALKEAEKELADAQQGLAAAEEQVRQVTWAKLIAEQQEPLKQWLDEFRDAKELLEFAISRGYKIEDKIVQDIKAVEVTLSSGITPTKDQLANFEKAYRDLAYFLKPVTAETLQASFQKEYCAPLVVSLVVSLLVAVFLLVVLARLGEPRLALLISVAVTPPIFWFLYLFTGFVNEQKLNQIVLFCYVFCFVAILSPFMSLLLPVAPLWFQNIMIDGPIGIVHGCVLPPSSSPGSNNSRESNRFRWVPDELICESGADQWVLNIGGATEILGTLSVPIVHFSHNSDLPQIVQIREGIVCPTMVTSVP